MRAILGIFLLFAVLSTCLGQFRENREFDSVTLHGSLSGAHGQIFLGLSIQLSSLTGEALSQKAQVEPNGDFEFMAVSPGSYLVQVVDGAGNHIAEQMVELHNSMETVQVRLPRATEAVAGGGTVSVQELTHKVPGKARKELEAADKAAHKNDWDSTLAHLQQAVAIDPEFLQAYRAMILIYTRLQQPEGVISSCNSALKLDPHAADVYTFLSAAFESLGKYDIAEQSARRAISLNAADPRSRFLLGLSLANQDKGDGEALQYLRQTENQFPLARFAAARILARQGQLSEAQTELEHFLPSALDNERDQVNAAIQKLHAAQVRAAESRTTETRTGE